ncbi:unnamed protein product [Symbiodinium sp. KB8]|nr:unnamed protein product [Symbiodinium sp. KB8]
MPDASQIPAAHIRPSTGLLLSFVPGIVPQRAWVKHTLAEVPGLIKRFTSGERLAPLTGRILRALGQALDKPFTSPCDFAKLRSEDSCLMLEDCRFAASTLGPSFERLQRLWREQQVATGSGVPAHSITPTFVPSTTSAATTSFRKETRDATFGGGDLSPAPMGRRGTGSVKEAPLTKYNECWWGNEQRQMMANVSRLSRRIFKSWEYARGRGGSWGGSCG